MTSQTQLGRDRQGAARTEYAIHRSLRAGACVPDLPGCMTTGQTLDETRANIREAIAGHVRTLQEFGEPVPEPASLAAEVEVG